MLLTNIYGLFDPRNPSIIMYVGKGSSNRARHHWLEFINRGTAENKRELGWFKKLKDEGVEPSWQFLEENIENWQERERYWIAYWRNKNSELCNILDGGNEISFNISSLGGRTANRIHPGLARRAGHLGGCRTKELHPDLAVKRGRLGGQRAVESGQLASLRTPENQSKAGHFGGLVGGRKMNEKYGKEWAIKRGKLGGPIAMHVRWHIKRGIINLNCKFCLEAKNVA